MGVLRHLVYMRRNLFFAFVLVLGFGLTLSSCAPGVYGGTSVGVGVGPTYYGGYGPGYYGRPYGYGYGYGPRYYGRPVIVNPQPRFYGGYRGDAGFHGGGYRGGNGGYRGGSGGGGFHGGGGGGRRGGR